jgi:methyltransferase (TIGR00027 family)
MKRNRRSLTGLVLAFGFVLLAIVSAVQIPSSHALKPGEPSLAVEQLAGLRAIAAMDPDEKIRNPDYLAEKFLPAEFWFFSPLIKDYTKTRKFIDTFRISSYFMANAMTFHIDGIYQGMAANGVRQVVHIGSGLDSRPYRFGKNMPGVRFFEVEQPATLAMKKNKVKAIFGKLPRNVTYVSVDYRTRPFFDALKQAGYNTRRNTLFIWEGTTVFTSPEVVDKTMRSIAGNSAPGSQVVFDYVLEELIQRDFSKHRRAGFYMLRSGVKGEPWKFGIAEGQAGTFASERGLRLISDLGATELAGKYLVKSDGSIDGKPTAYCRIMHAAVGQ